MDEVDRFRSSLRLGTGRAMLILRADPGNPVLHAALHHACTHNLVFDPQCEEARAPYLERLIDEIGQAPAFWRDLLAQIEQPGDDAVSRDVVQAFEILCLLAAADESLDRHRLTAFLLGCGFEPVGRDCMGAFVTLQG